MAKGLFTAGNPVADILEKRRIRAQDLQNQMMQAAAQGAARPDKARLASFLGSAIGRGLAGAMPDPELDKIKEEQEGIQGLQKDFAAALTQGKADEQLALANKLIQKGYTQEGTQLFQQAQLNKQEEAKQAAAAQKKSEEELEASMEVESNLQLADSIRKDYPNIADQVEAGNPEAISKAMNILSTAEEKRLLQDKRTQEQLQADLDLSVQNEANLQLADSIRKEFPDLARQVELGQPDAIKAAMGTLAPTGGAKGRKTAGETNLAVYLDHQAKIKRRLEDDPFYSETEAQSELNAIKSALSIALDPSETATAVQDAKDVSGYIIETSDKNKDLGKTIASYDQTLAMLDAGLYTGFGAEALQTVRRLAVAVGIADNDTMITAANVDQFRANAMDMVMQRIQQTVGAISDAEMQKFAEAGIDLAKTPEGNRLIIQTAKQIAVWEKRKAEAINLWYNKQRNAGLKPRRDEAVEYAKQWASNNKITLNSKITDPDGANKPAQEAAPTYNQEALKALRMFNELNP
jgi:hypothetical protein